MTVSPKRRDRNSQVPQNAGRAAKRSQLARSLKLEALEKRELLAADVAPFQNSVFAYDVDGDFVVSPLDALTIINKLNFQGAGSLEGQLRETSDGWVDVDGDNYLTPLDALSVINLLNTGEGEHLNPKLVEVKYEFYRVNPDGTAGDLIPDADLSTPDVNDAIISKNEKIIVRTTMKDLRSLATSHTNPRGVFSAYHDFHYTNEDGSTSEKLQLQWSDYFRIKFSTLTFGGSVTFGWGAQSVTVNPVFAFGEIDPEATLTAVRTAMNSLFGADNVRVQPFEPFQPGTPLKNAEYEVHFRNNLARQDVTPNLAVVADNLQVAGAGPGIELTTVSNVTPANDFVAAGALEHNVDNGSITNSAGTSPIIRYTNGPAGILLDSTNATQTLQRLGGFANVTASQSAAIATRFLGVVDTLFVGSEEGLVRLSGTATQITSGATGNNLGIALFDDSGNRAEYLGPDQILFREATVRIVDRLTASNDTYTYQEDLGGLASTIILNPGVLANDQGIDDSGNIVPALQLGSTITDVTPISGVPGTITAGTMTIVNGGTQLQFAPAQDAHGQGLFRYTIRNTRGDTATGTITINLTSVNDPPRVINSSFATVENVAAPGLVISANEIFVPGPANEQSEVPPQTVSITAVHSIAGTNGTVQLVGGQIQYIPNANYNGTAFFTVDASDNLGASITGVTVTVTIESTNDAPIVVRSNFTTPEDTAITIPATDIFTPGPPDESNQTVSLTIVTPPDSTRASATINAQGQLVITPAPNYFGSVVLEVRGTDNGVSPPNLTADATLTLQITSVNDPPIAMDDDLQVLGLGTPVFLDVLGNDTAGPGSEIGEAIRVVSVTPASIGSVRLVGSQVEYTPPASNFGETATFTYTIEDDFGSTATATVYVLILPPASPYAVDDNYRSNSTFRQPESSTGSNVYQFDVLANDYATDPSSKQLVGTPTLISGEGEIGIDGNLITFKPDPYFFGEVVFSYEMTGNLEGEGNTRTVATATILIEEVNDAPVAVGISSQTNEDIALTLNANSFGLSSGPFENDLLRFTSAVMVNPSAGSVTIVNGEIVFTPTPDSNETALVRYIVTDDGSPNLPSNEATLTITVNPVNDPPVVNNDTVGPTAEDTSLTILVSTLLANDTPGPANESGQSLTIVPFSGVRSTQHGTIQMSTVGGQQVIIYTPNADYFGPDQFTYEVTDGQPQNSTASGTVFVTVTEVNDPPVATQISQSAYAGVATTFDISAQIAQMSRGAANESGQTLQVVRVETVSGTQGTVVLNANGTITYTAPLGASGTDTFSYVIRDNGTTNGAADPKEATGTITVAIQPFQPSSMSGVVYFDDNGNGILDASELRIGGADVTLTIAADPNVPNSVQQIVSTVTLADGSYSFDLLPPGTYTVSYAIPALTTDGPGANSFVSTITAPGGLNSTTNFAVAGVTSRYASILEYLASSYYFRDPGLATNGLYAVIGDDGKSEWTSARGDFKADAFHEVVLSEDGSKAYLTAVRGPNNSIYTAELSRSQFVQTKDETGTKYVRVLARNSDLTWRQVNLSAPPVEINSSRYLAAVDELFSKLAWS